jgi:hypothetical protein
MPSRIRIGPDGGPYVIVEEDNGDINISSPNGNVDFQTDDISNVGALTADSVSTEQASIQQSLASAVGNGQTVSSSTSTKVQLDTAVEEDADIYTVDLTNNSIDVLKSGVYFVNALVTWDSGSGWTSGDAIITDIFINGAEMARNRQAHSGYNARYAQDANRIFRLSANDTINVRCFQSSGVDQELFADFSESQIYLTVGRLG